MKRWHPGISLILLALFLVTPFLHASHFHGTDENVDHDGISGKCVVCAAGPLFETSSITAFTFGLDLLPASAADSRDAAVCVCVPLTVVDPRGPPLSLVSNIL